MGGVINVAIRLRNGEAFCTERWTNNTPYWFKDPKMYAGDEAHVRAYLEMTRNNDWLLDCYAPGLSQPVECSEYGLIVWDYVTNTILDNNSYSDPVSFDPIYTGGDNPKRETWEACAKAGIIHVERTRISTGGDIPQGEYLREVIEKRGPLSPEEALRLGQEAWEAEWGETGRRARPSKEELEAVALRAGERWEMVRTMFYADPAPMTYHHYPEARWDEETETRESLPPEMRAKLEEIGFPLTAEEGLNSPLRPPPEPRELGAEEKRAREVYQWWRQGRLKFEGDTTDPQQYDGVRFEDAPEETRDLMTRAGNQLTEDQQRNLRFSDLLG